jgi:hypothetical protein
MCRLEGLAAGERAREADLESYLRRRYPAGDAAVPAGDDAAGDGHGTPAEAESRAESRAER